MSEETGIMIKDRIEYWQNKYFEEKEKNKKLEEKAKFTMEVIGANYISKDKIKEKIKEYQEIVNEFEEYWSKDPRKFTKEKCIDYYKIEVLQELLEEGN